MNLLNEEEVQKRIKDALLESIPDENRRADIAFHMTDWKSDLKGLIELYTEKEQSNERVKEILDRFLIHAPNHVAAAKKLMGHGSMQDIFEVGILEADE
jgi:hypothetical protein